MVDKEKKGKCASLMNFIWNSESKELCGRSGKRWGEVFIYYLFYYSWLLAFYSALVCFFYSTLNSDHPALTGKQSILENKPGLAYRPYVKNMANLIPVSQKYKKEILESIEAELSYKNQLSNVYRNQINCHKDNSYGYDNNEPCVLLKLNKIYGFVPKRPLTKPAGLKVDIYEKKQDIIHVQCKGRRGMDIDNMGSIHYYPDQGFDVDAFPWTNQHDDITPPYVWVKFKGLTKFVAVTVECQVYADNIEVDKSFMIGYTKFELVVL